MINFNEFFVLSLCIQPVTATLQELPHDSETQKRCQGEKFIFQENNFHNNFTRP